MEVLKGKASLAALNDLHNKVATALGEGLDDPKVLNSAIAFLKNNNITADAIESEELISLADSIRAIAKGDSKLKEITVEDMLLIGS